MFVRYLAIPLGVSLAFALTRNLSLTLPCRSRENSRTLEDVRHIIASEHDQYSVEETIDRQENFCHGFTSLANATQGTISRRNAFLMTGAATTAAMTVAPRADANSIPFEHSILNDNGENDKNDGNKTSSMIANVENDHERLLRSASLYRVRTKSNSLQRSKLQDGKIFPGQVVNKVPAERFIDDLKSKRAILLGEHHPEGRDHRLQAALIRSLYDAIHQDKSSSFTTSSKIAVGLEAVQRKFQPILDQYCAGAIDEEELVRATEWESRWYWSFEAYKPIFQTCRELDIGLLALDIATEDRFLVEQGGIEALDGKTLEEYVPDQKTFSSFGNTVAYETFVSYTLKPPYELQQRTKRNQTSNKNIEYSNFVARQMLRDEGMASAAYGWLSKNPSGILVGCIGINHATFGCGVQGRLEQKLASNDVLVGRTQFKQKNQEPAVASVLINPEPLNTGTELKLCQGEGRTPVDDDEEDEDGLSFARQIFVPNIRNQVCIQNSVEVQNYALQLDFVSSTQNLQGRRAAIEDAAKNYQTRRGETALGLSDYLFFSPKESIASVV